MAQAKPGIVKKIADDQFKTAPQAVLEDLFEDYYKRRRQIYWMNFIRGIYFGFGGVLGGTLVVALVLWLLSVFQYIPFLDSITRAAEHSLQQH
jgi:uncharacterized membrane protein YfcA